jgi:hypothetical protein
MNLKILSIDAASDSFQDKTVWREQRCNIGSPENMLLMNHLPWWRFWRALKAWPSSIG